MEFLFLPEVWMALVTLTLLEIILGVDNIIFIAILAGRLPPHQQAKGRDVGLFSLCENTQYEDSKTVRKPVKLRAVK